MHGWLDTGEVWQTAHSPAKSGGVQRFLQAINHPRATEPVLEISDELRHCITYNTKDRISQN